MRFTLFLLLALVACGTPVGDGDGVVDSAELPGVGWRATLQTYAHGVSGVATVIDENTIEVTDWNYDGGGLDSRLFLLADGEMFHRDFELTGNQVGTPGDGGTLTIEIPAEASFDQWNLITLWCVPAGVSFGDGVFKGPSEPVE